LKKPLLFIALLLTTFLSNAQELEIPAFGSDSTFEVLTWNIEWFPKNGQTTVDYVSEIINDLDVDLLAMQEIDDKNYFDQLLENLDGRAGFYVVSKYSNLAYIYKTDVVEVDTIYEIYTSQPYWRPFPRAPMVMEMRFMDAHYVIINNHFKCCGDGILDSTDPWDEETRRLDASILLEQFIDSIFPDTRVIMLGDLNDDLADEPDNNVFNVFLDDPEKYLFTDLTIAEGSISEWSYPSWPSHLDHILITNELFVDFENEYAAVQTLKLDEYFAGGFYEYDKNVSDHRPVALKIKPEAFLNTTETQFKPALEERKLVIFDMKGRIVKNCTVLKNQSTIVWNAEKLPEGIYFAKMQSDAEIVAVGKMIILR